MAVLATGPSLTVRDCETVRDAGFVSVGVNSAWLIAPWVDALYAGDARYWRAYHAEIDAAGVTGKRYSRSSHAEKHSGAKYLKTRMDKDYNSGQLAIEMAARNGADLIVLLGFDASVSDGVHCHGPHEKTPNPTRIRCKKWLEQFARIPDHYPDARIINCSRKTAIKTFPQQSLESVIEGIFKPEIRSS